jgi:hypothetical protein
MNVHKYKIEGANLFDDDLSSVVPFNEMTTTYEHICEHTPYFYHYRSFPKFYEFLEVCEIGSSQTSMFSSVT